ncbi:GTP pyrophosphokinase [Arthrobacter sp. UCD-GKA]|uniref:GTP pyrophosphokinase n=1 Tax=Arthrobacter sp. UCD-GKA TaxID=1913576 RepID=UPI0008DD23DC|nr:GTP pyrophosphokinase family protein [Arthrobacter sp. UCD-GKA]OIH83747.1 GTP pyrophosphokinase [Arthrobacter sp. UCD-GKA]
MSGSNEWFDSVDPETIQRMADSKNLRDGFARFMLNYQFAMDEIMTKINILKTEFEHLHDYSPIEHVSARLKSPESLLSKARRRDLPLSFETLSENVLDVAGVRIVCSFISDAYWVAKMITSQPDITVVTVKDYIEEPKPNGYKSLHIIVKVPIFLSESVQNIHVELQIRTVAMDFWASLEHKIYYKYDKEVPAELLAELKEAAGVADRLDSTMERIHNEVHTGASGSAEK